MKTTITSTRKADAPLPLSALQLLAPPLRLMSAAMWKVMLQRDVVYYGKLEETVTSLCETVPGLLHQRHRARLTMGLRALMILEELRQSDPPDAQHVLQELEKLQTSSIPNGKRKDQKVEEAKRSFQTLVHSLLKSVDARKQFFKEEFHLHYGINYVTSLEKLLWEFLIRLDQLLPVPDLAQTVSWLSGAPAVLEECARSASQPQLLRTLLQHEKCLGHLGSTSLLSSTGDAILSSLSLPLSGKVQQTIQSKSLPTSKRVSNPAPATPRSTRGSAKQAQSQVTPVIGSISSADLQKSNEKAVSNVRQDETASEVCRKPSRELRSSSKGQTLEKDPKEDYYVGDMLVTVISQSSGSEVDDDDDDGEEKVESTESREGAEISTLYISCMKRQLRVVVPRLNVSSDLPVHLNHQSDGNKKTSSPCQPASEDCVGNRGSVLRKRKFMDSSATPEKRLTSSVGKLTSACSPCIPFVLRPPVGTPETPSPLVKSSGEYIEESDNETAGNVKRKVEFRQQYYKTKNGSYVPTLQEFWNPLCPTMSPESRR